MRFDGKLRFLFFMDKLLYGGGEGRWGGGGKDGKFVE